MTMVQPISQEELDEILADLKKPEEGVPDLLLELFEEPVGRNDEYGFRKWCRGCNDTTGHLILPTKAWQVEQCRRCGLITRFKCVYPLGQDRRRPLLINPDLSAREVLILAIQTFGPEYVMWCAEQYTRQRAKEEALKIGKKFAETRKAELEKWRL